jgi:MFS family permease
MAANEVTRSLIYPTLPPQPFLVQHFHPELNRQELGARVGLLGSVFFAGQLCSSTLWGKVSDDYGRKPTILLGFAGTVVCCLAFGLAPSYRVALAARFGWGFLNGNVGVAKAFMADVCPPSHTARGFAMLGFASGLGRLLGPSVGARLADEVWFPSKPFLMPCIAVAILQISAMVFVAMHMQGGAPSEMAPQSRHETEDGCVDVVLSTRDKSSPPPKDLVSVPPRTVSTLLRDPHVVAACMLYASLGFATTITYELIALWPILPPARGGFCFSSSMIGRVIIVHAVFVLFIQANLFHHIANRVGYIRISMVGSLCFAGLTVALPYTGTGIFNDDTAAGSLDCSELVGSPDNQIDWGTWGAVAVISGMQSGVQVMIFTSSFVLISNSCFPQERGVVNGGAQTLVALTRMLAPSFGGAVFQWSVSAPESRPWPFNVHFTFILAALAAMMVWCCAAVLPTTGNKPKRLQ